MDERMRFMVDHVSGEWSMLALVRALRDQPDGGLQVGWPLPRGRACWAWWSARGRRRRTGGRRRPRLAELVVKLREARPSWGPRKIVARLRLDHPDLVWPAASTAGEILKRAGLVKRAAAGAAGAAAGRAR